MQNRVILKNPRIVIVEAGADAGVAAGAVVMAGIADLIGLQIVIATVEQIVHRNLASLAPLRVALLPDRRPDTSPFCCRENRFRSTSAGRNLPPRRKPNP